MVSCRWAAQSKFLEATTLVITTQMAMNTRKIRVRGTL